MKHSWSRHLPLAALICALAACGTDSDGGGASSADAGPTDGGAVDGAGFCGAGTTFKDGACVPDVTTCRTHGDCPVGEYCGEGDVCTGSGTCEADGDCDGGAMNVAASQFLGQSVRHPYQCADQQEGRDQRIGTQYLAQRVRHRCAQSDRSAP